MTFSLRGMGQSAVASIDKGVKFYNSGQYNDAMQHFRDALQFEPNNEDATLYLGLCLGQKKDYKGAFKQFKLAAKLNPKNAEPWLHRGLLEQEMGKFKPSLRSYDKALRIKPDYADAWYNSGVVYFHLKKWNESAENLRKAADLDPLDPDPILQLGNVGFQTGDLKTAIDYYTQTLELNDKQFVAWFNRARSLSHLGDLYGALKDYTAALEISKDYDTYLNRGIVSTQLNLPNEAIQDFNQAIALDTNRSEAFYNRGYVYFKTRNSEPSRLDFRKVVFRDPADPEAWYFLGRIALQEGDHDKALVLFNKSIEANKKYGPSWLQRGDTQLAMLEEKAACKDWKKAFKLGDPDLKRAATERMQMHCGK